MFIGRDILKLKLNPLVPVQIFPLKDFDTGNRKIRDDRITGRWHITDSMNRELWTKCIFMGVTNSDMAEKLEARYEELSEKQCKDSKRRCHSLQFPNHTEMIESKLEIK